jgi:5'-methylthioadenosine phosphorylase
MKIEPVPIAVIGGSGLYQMEALEGVSDHAIETPFGEPSAPLHIGTLSGKRVAFLPRHGSHHQISPSAINYRANIWALKSIGVRWIISISAVGSLRESIHPRECVVPDQFFDRTKNTVAHTYFDRGIVAHVSFADPVCPTLATLLYQAASSTGAKVHWKGTYVNMEGPAFSTRAESEFHRHLGFDVIGMTNLAEAKLAREAEISYATLAMVTDYDCWHDREAAVSVESVITILKENVEVARKTIQAAVPLIQTANETPAHRALDNAILTPRDHWPEEKIESLGPILSRLAD